MVRSNLVDRLVEIVSLNLHEPDIMECVCHAQRWLLLYIEILLQFPEQSSKERLCFQITLPIGHRRRMPNAWVRESDENKEWIRDGNKKRDWDELVDGKSMSQSYISVDDDLTLGKIPQLGLCLWVRYNCFIPHFGLLFHKTLLRPEELLPNCPK